MRVLVTGGHGFLGHHLVRRLLDAGDRVRCVGRPERAPESLRGLDVEWVRGDVTRPDTLAPAVAGVEEVHHLAALLTGLREADLFRTNAGGTANLLAAVAREPNLRRVVLCSSIAVCGPCLDGVPLREDAPPRPLTWYGKSKALAERIAKAWSARIPITVVRPPVVYGPRDRGLLGAFRAIRMGVRPVLGRQPKSLSWVYGPDLAAAFVALARSDRAAGRAYFAGHPDPAPMEDFMLLAADALGRRGVEVRLPHSFLSIVATASDVVSQATGVPAMLTRNKMEEVKPSAWLCASDAAYEDAGWRATTPLSVGVPETARWYAEHGWI